MKKLSKEVVLFLTEEYSDRIIWEQTFKGRELEALGHWEPGVSTALDGINLWASNFSLKTPQKDLMKNTEENIIPWALKGTLAERYS